MGLKLCICLIERKYPGIIKVADFGGENHAVVEIEQGNSRVQGIAMVGGLSPLRETLWKEKIDTKGIDVSAKLTWQDLSVTVFVGSGETQNCSSGFDWICRALHLDGSHGPLWLQIIHSLGCSCR